MRHFPLFNALMPYAPEILRFVKLCYEDSSFLIYGAFTIKSTEGFQQGDTLATFGFCLVLPKTGTWMSKPKTGYLDDVAFADEWRTTIHDLLSIKKACEKLGLLLNEKKCEVTAFGSIKKEIERAFRETFPTIQRVDALQTDSAKSTHLYALNLRESSTASFLMSLSVKFACPRNKEGLVFQTPAL